MDINALVPRFLADFKKIGYVPSYVCASKGRDFEAHGKISEQEIEISWSPGRVTFGGQEVQTDSILEAYQLLKKTGGNFGKTREQLIDQFCDEFGKDLAEAPEQIRKVACDRVRSWPATARIWIAGKGLVVFREDYDGSGGPVDSYVEVLAGTDWPKSRLYQFHFPRGSHGTFDPNACDVPKLVATAIKHVRPYIEKAQDIKSRDAKLTLKERLENTDVYPELGEKGRCYLTGKVPDWLKKAKIEMGQHPEGADRGGYVFYLTLGKETVMYRDDSGWE